MQKKQQYAAPATEVLELHLEGVIATSVRGNVNIDNNPMSGFYVDDQEW